MSGKEIFEGGCLCGEIRYRFEAAPLFAGYCHCSVCQRANAAPVVAAAIFPSSSFRLLKGEPKSYHSTSRAIRHFCGDCGSQLFFEPLDSQEKLEVWIPTLDEPDAIAPLTHIWTSSARKWFQVADDLPKFEEERPKDWQK